MPALQSAGVPTDAPPPAPTIYLPGSKDTAAQALKKAPPSAGLPPPETQKATELPLVEPKATPASRCRAEGDRAPGGGTDSDPAAAGRT
jgi:hypothetical protein